MLLLLVIIITCCYALTPKQDEQFAKHFQELSKATNAKDYAGAMAKMLHVDPECIHCYVQLSDKNRDTSDEELHRRCNEICHDRDRKTRYL